MMARQDALVRPDALAGQRSAASARSSRLIANLAPWLFLTPWLLGVLAITLGPMLVSLYLSFTDYNLLGDASWVGLDNYLRIFTEDPKVWAALSVTVHYVLLSVPLQLAFALGIAVVLNRARRRRPRSATGWCRTSPGLKPPSFSRFHAK